MQFPFFFFFSYLLVVKEKDNIVVLDKFFTHSYLEIYLQMMALMLVFDC